MNQHAYKYGYALIHVATGEGVKNVGLILIGSQIVLDPLCYNAISGSKVHNCYLILTYPHTSTASIWTASSPVLDLNHGPLVWKVNALTTNLKCNHTLAFP